jgi:hypothetical protein
VDEEAALSLGLMADAGEESLALVRFLDSEHGDKSELSTESHASCSGTATRCVH